MRKLYTETRVSYFNEISGEPEELVRRKHKDGTLKWFIDTNPRDKDQNTLKEVSDRLVERYESKYQEDIC